MNGEQPSILMTNNTALDRHIEADTKKSMLKSEISEIMRLIDQGHAPNTTDSFKRESTLIKS